MMYDPQLDFIVIASKPSFYKKYIPIIEGTEQGRFGALFSFAVFLISPVYVSMINK